MIKRKRLDFVDGLENCKRNLLNTTRLPLPKQRAKTKEPHQAAPYFEVEFEPSIPLDSSQNALRIVRESTEGK
jgi:hypothetical protein